MKKLDKIDKLIYRDCANAMKASVWIYTASDVLAGFLAVFTAQKLGIFADAVFASNVSLGMRHVTDLLICILLTVLAVPLIGLLGSMLMLKNALTHERMLQGRFLDKTFENAMKIDEGEVQYRLEDDATDFRCYWVMLWEYAFVTPFLFLSVLYHSTQIHVGFTLIVMGISVIKLVVPMAVKKIESKYDRETREYNTKVRAYETEFTTKPHIVKLWGLTDPMLEKMDLIFQQFYKKIFKKSVRCTTIANQISAFLDTFCILLILLAGALMVSEGIITAGAVVAMIGYFSVYNTIIENISWMIRKIPLIKNCVERLRLLYDDDESLAGNPVGIVSEITASHLSFSYEGCKVWDDLNFSIHAGEKVAICGANGSGKSTLLKVIAGLVKEYHGNLMVNGVQLRSLAVGDWRRQFAYVTQDPYLFQGSVLENVALGNLSASQEEVNEVLQKTGIGSLAQRQVSVEQNDLSGGEKQKISIARALLRHTPILMMDEPSNNLDEETVAWLKDFIRRSDQTIIYVSHDETLSDLADHRVIL